MRSSSSSRQEMDPLSLHRLFQDSTSFLHTLPTGLGARQIIQKYIFPPLPTPGIINQATPTFQCTHRYRIEGTPQIVLGHGGNILLFEVVTSAIHVGSEDGRYLQTIKTSDGTNDVAVGPTGHIYVPDMHNACICVYNESDGTLSHSIDVSSKCKKPNIIAVGKDGTLIVTGLGPPYCRFHVFQPDGTYKKHFDLPRSKRGDIQEIQVQPNTGNFVVRVTCHEGKSSSTSLCVFQPDGTFLREHPGEYVALDGDGNMVIYDQVVDERILGFRDRFQLLTPAGAFIKELNLRSDGAAGSVNDIAVDRQGRIIVVQSNLITVWQ